MAPPAEMSAISHVWLGLYGGAALVALVPIIWATVDILRRPPLQFSTPRKVFWVLSMALGWVIFWPLSVVSAVLYLTVLRRQFPVVAAGTPMATWDPYDMAAGGRPPPLPLAGWYPDPAGGPGERWWDGRGWSDHLRSGSAP